MKNILMTGSTGIVGVPALQKFLQNGDKVYCLVRRQGLKTARERLIKKLGVTELPMNCFVIEGDITMPNCGLNPGGIELLKLVKIDTVFHCAALTKMEDKNSDDSNKINVIGTHNIIGLARSIHAKDFHFVSTAYVANGGSNIYERTKLKAEQMVELSEMPYTISRLSVVIGDSKTGEITNFSGLYGFFLSAYKLLKATNFQGHLDVEAAPGTTLNLITNDWAAECLFQLTHKEPSNQVFDVVSNQVMTVKQIIDKGSQHIGIRQNLTINDYVDTSKASTGIQLMFNRVTEILRPYTGKNFSVNHNKLQKFLGSNFPTPPVINESVLDKALDFAIVAAGLSEETISKKAS